MIDPTLPPEIIIERQRKMINALMSRIERGNDLTSTHFSLFQSALLLQNEIRSKSQHLEEAMLALGTTTDQLASANQNQRQAQRNLSEVLDMLDEGFALFSDDRLVAFNAHFATLAADIETHIQPGLSYANYQILLANSTTRINEPLLSNDDWLLDMRGNDAKPFVVYVLQLLGDKWVQANERRSHDGTIAIIHTDITNLVRENRIEKHQLIDAHLQFVQGAFDQMTIGVASFSENFELLVQNKIFVDLWNLPIVMCKKGTHLEKIFRFLSDNKIIENLATVVNQIQFGSLKISQNIKKNLVRYDNVVLDFQMQALPQGGYIVNIRDITAEETARIAMAKINETLESHVKARTTELSVTNKLLVEQYEKLENTKEDLRFAKERAEAANASKTKFLAAASHDLLQPINAAKIYISMLKEQHNPSQKLDYISRLDRAFNNVEFLLHDLLEISRLESLDTDLKQSWIDIFDILQNLEESFQNSKGLEKVKLNFVKPHLYVKSNAHYLSRSLQNLIANAIQYTPNGKILVGCRRKGGDLAIEVWDTGIGIAPEHIDSVFEEFTRLSAGQSALGGMGLGLSIVEYACRHLGHKIEVKSELGKGSVFRILLPLAPSKPALMVRAPMVFQPMNLELGLLIMLVDNDPEVLQATRLFLQNWGMDVVTAASTQEALDHNEILGEVPDLLILDYQLDGADTGIHTLAALRKHAGTLIPALMITANLSEDLDVLADQMHFDIIHKPIDLEKLRKFFVKNYPHKSLLSNDASETAHNDHPFV